MGIKIRLWIRHVSYKKEAKILFERGETSSFMKNLKPKVCSVTIFMEPSFQSQSFGVIEIVITFEKKDIVGTNIENGI